MTKNYFKFNFHINKLFYKMPYYKNISALCSVFKDTDPRELGLSIS